MRALFVLENSALNRRMNTGLENLAWGLAEQGLEIHVLAGGHWPRENEYHLPDTVRYHFTRQPVGNPASFLSIFEELLCEYQIDVVVGWISNTALLATSTAARRVRFIANLGQMPPRSVFFRPVKQALCGRIAFGQALNLVRAIYRYPSICSAVVPNSKAVARKSISAYGITPEKCLVIYRGVDVDAYSFRWRTSRVGRGVDILFAGNVAQNKGIWDLLRALRLIQTPLRLRLCGPDPKAIVPRIARMIGDTPHKIEHEGPVKMNELIVFYQRCDIFVFPSHSEGMPKALLEAMSCGAPVVCSDIEPHREVVQSRENGLLVPVKSPRALAEAIEMFVVDGALRSKCSFNARKTVEKHFGKKFEIDKWMKLLSTRAQ